MCKFQAFLIESRVLEIQNGRSFPSTGTTKFVFKAQPLREFTELNISVSPRPLHVLVWGLGFYGVRLVFCVGFRSLLGLPVSCWGKSFRKGLGLFYLTCPRGLHKLKRGGADVLYPGNKVLLCHDLLFCVMYGSILCYAAW